MSEPPGGPSPGDGRGDLAELRVPVTELRRRPGSRRDISVRPMVPGLAVSTAGVVADEALALDVTLESISGGVTIEGTLVVAWEGACRRCLTPVRRHTEVAVSEVAETHHTEGETWPLEPDVLDLNALVAELALVALPLAPLCRPDCAGPAPGSVPVLAEGHQPVPGDETGGDGDRATPVDPRWAALDQLRFDDR